MRVCLAHVTMNLIPRPTLTDDLVERFEKRSCYGDFMQHRAWELVRDYYFTYCILQSFDKHTEDSAAASEIIR